MAEFGIRPILVGVDGSSSSMEAARWAAAEARLRGWPVRVVCAYSWPAPQMPLSPLAPDSTEEALRTHAQVVVNQAVSAVRAAAPAVEVTGAAVMGLAAYKLIELSPRAGMVVVGHRGHGGFAALRLGAVAAKVAGHAHCPAVVVRPGAGDRTVEQPLVLVGVDESPASGTAVVFAFEEADLRGGVVHVLRSWEPPAPAWRSQVWPHLPDLAAVEAAEALRLANWIQPWQDLCPHVAVRQQVTSAKPAAALIEAAMNATLLVVGSHGHGPFAGLLLGSVSQQVIHHAPCPVAVVR